MLRLGHVIPSLGIGGAERSLLELAPRLRQHGIESSVVSLRAGGELAASLRSHGIAVVELGIASGVPSLAELRALVASIGAIEPDVIQGWMYHGNVAASIAAGLLLRRPPVIWSIRTSIVRQNGVRIAAPGIIPASRVLRRFPDLILFNSRIGRRSHVAAGIRGRRNKVVPNGFDPERFRPDPEARQQIRDRLGLRRELVFGCLARLDPLKGHRVLLEAFARARRAMPESRLLLVGKGMSPENPEFTALLPHGLDPASVLAVGTAENVPPWLAAMDVAVMPSLVEGFPNALGEAMSCGLCCIATDAGDAGLMLRGHGFLVPTGDADALAEAMIAACRLDPAKRREIGLAARATIEARYSLATMAATYAGIYRRFAADASAPASRRHA